MCVHGEPPLSYGPVKRLPVCVCVSRSRVRYSCPFGRPGPFPHVCLRQVERLLKLGAYDVFREGDEGDRASKAFCEEVRAACTARTACNSVPRSGGVRLSGSRPPPCASLAVCGPEVWPGSAVALGL